MRTKPIPKSVLQPNLSIFHLLHTMSKNVKCLKLVFFLLEITFGSLQRGVCVIWIDWDDRDHLCYWKKSILCFSRKMSNNLKCPKFDYLLKITLGNLLGSISLLEITLVIYYGVCHHISTNYNDRSQVSDWIIKFSVFCALCPIIWNVPNSIFHLKSPWVI